MAKKSKPVPRITQTQLLRATLRALKERCPGVHQTDQITGETFATLIDNALTLARVAPK